MQNLYLHQFAGSNSNAYAHNRKYLYLGNAKASTILLRKQQIQLKNQLKSVKKIFFVSIESILVELKNYCVKKLIY